MSPIYLVLFVSATYFLNRPCVYCSLLLTILVISLYDFHTNWFEPRAPASTTLDASNNGTLSLQDAALETASIAASAVNSTLTSIAQSAVQGLKRRAEIDPQPSISGAEWLKGIFGRKEWRIPCLDVAVRL